MSTPNTPADTGDAGAADTWQPEPQQWHWNDLFSAPMMALKLKAAIVSFFTVVALLLTYWGYREVEKVVVGIIKDTVVEGHPIWYWLLLKAFMFWVGAAALLIVFSLGTTFVSIFLKADIVNNELITFGTACRRYFKRFRGAFMVPLMLVMLVGLFHLFVYSLLLLCSGIPYVGSLLYAIFYPLGWIFCVLAILALVGLMVSGFLFPAILAIRKPQPTSDTFMDIVEAAAGKPYVLVASLFVTWIMVVLLYILFMVALSYPKQYFAQVPLFSWGAEEVTWTDRRADGMVDKVQEWAKIREARIDPIPRIAGRVEAFQPIVAFQKRNIESVTTTSLFSFSLDEQVVLAGGDVPNFLWLPFKLQGGISLSVADSEGKGGAQLVLGDDGALRIEDRPSSYDLERRGTEIIVRARLDEPEIADPFYEKWIYWFPGLITGAWKILLNVFIIGYLINLGLACGMLTYLIVREDDYGDDDDREEEPETAPPPFAEEPAAPEEEADASAAKKSKKKVVKKAPAKKAKKKKT